MVVAIAMTAVLAECKSNKTELAAQFKGCNILLVSVDTLRAAHLGCYGYAKKTPMLPVKQTITIFPKKNRPLPYAQKAANTSLIYGIKNKFNLQFSEKPAQEKSDYQLS